MLEEIGISNKRQSENFIGRLFNLTLRSVIKHQCVSIKQLQRIIGIGRNIIQHKNESERFLALAALRLRCFYKTCDYKKQPSAERSKTLLTKRENRPQTQQKPPAWKASVLQLAS